MLGKWLGLLKLEVPAKEATPALLGDVAMSSPWVTFSYSAIQSRGRRRSSLCCTQWGRRTSLCCSDAPADCRQCAIALPVLMILEQRRNISLTACSEG